MLSRLQWILLPGILIALGVVVVYLGYLWMQNDAQTLQGTVSVYYFNELNPYTGGGCTLAKEGPGEFADLKRDTPVVVRDEAGSVLASGGLSRGSDTLSTCTFAFAVGPVPVAASYTVQVGERPPATFTRDELAARRWTVSFDFGGQPPQ